MPLLFDQISKTAELLTNRGVVQQVGTSLSPNKSLIYNKWLKCSVTFFQPLCITLVLFAFLSPPKGISNELLYISMRFDSTLCGREGGIVRCYQVFSSVRRMTRVNLEENHMLVQTDKPCSCKLCIFNLGFPAVFRPGLEFNPCSCEEALRGGFWKIFSLVFHSSWETWWMPSAITKRQLKQIHRTLSLITTPLMSTLDRGNSSRWVKFSLVVIFLVLLPGKLRFWYSYNQGLIKSWLSVVCHRL